LIYEDILRDNIGNFELTILLALIRIDENAYSVQRRLKSGAA